MSTLTEELEVCRYCEGGAAMSPAECPECEGEVMVRYEKQADPLSSGTDRQRTTETSKRCSAPGCRFDVNETGRICDFHTHIESDLGLSPKGWQPIACAPRDGTVVDLWHKDGFRLTDTWWDSDDEIWSCVFEDKDLTHWMPIPEPPL